MFTCIGVGIHLYRSQYSLVYRKVLNESNSQTSKKKMKFFKKMNLN